MSIDQGEAATILHLAGIPLFPSRSLEPPMLPGPVFFHELRTVARRRRSYALRTALGLFLLYLMVQSTNRWDTYAYQSETNREYTPGELALIGMNLFGSVIWLQGIVILLLTPAFVAGTIAEDRQRKVLSYLLASPLSGAEIVLGKLAARMVNLVVLVAVGLPVVSIALFLGGIDPADVWLWYGSSILNTVPAGRRVDFCLDVLAAAPGCHLADLSDRAGMASSAAGRMALRIGGWDTGPTHLGSPSDHGMGHRQQPDRLALSELCMAERLR